jgi:hypothetical protein
MINNKYYIVKRVKNNDDVLLNQSPTLSEQAGGKHHHKHSSKHRYDIDDDGYTSYKVLKYLPQRHGLYNDPYMSSINSGATVNGQITTGPTLVNNSIIPNMFPNNNRFSNIFPTNTLYANNNLNLMPTQGLFVNKSKNPTPGTIDLRFNNLNNLNNNLNFNNLNLNNDPYALGPPIFRGLSSLNTNCEFIIGCTENNASLVNIKVSNFPSNQCSPFLETLYSSCNVNNNNNVNLQAATQKVTAAKTALDIASKELSDNANKLPPNQVVLDALKAKVEQAKLAVTAAETEVVAASQNNNTQNNNNNNQVKTFLINGNVIGQHRLMTTMPLFSNGLRFVRQQPMFSNVVYHNSLTNMPFLI